MVPSFHPAKNNGLHIVIKTILSRRRAVRWDVELSLRAVTAAVDDPTGSKRLSRAGLALEEEALIGGYECFTVCSDGRFEGPWVIVAATDIVKVFRPGSKFI